jgi:hypothetical protein
MSVREAASVNADRAAAMVNRAVPPVQQRIDAKVAIE